MKGPFERLKYDLRRLWECPQCGHKVRTDGSATTQFCRCGKSNASPSVAMKLVGDGPRRLVPPVPPPAEVALTSSADVAVATQVEVIAVTAVEVIEVTTIDSQPPTNEAAGPDA